MRKFLFLLPCLLSVGLFLRPAASALTIGGTQDCDANAVIPCGISNSDQLSNAAAPGGITCLYKHFGISSTDISNFDSQAVAGSVTKTGKVIINGKTVATNAMTAGRQNMPGSTRFVCDNHGFFIRTPSVSFANSSLPAFVVMKSNQFAFAIIASCGNPVTAMPATPRVVTPPAITTPAPPTQTQSQTVTVVPPAVQSFTTSQPVPAKVIPNTGSGNVIGIGALASVIGGLGHFLYVRRKTAKYY